MQRFTASLALAGTLLLATTSGCYRYSYVERAAVQPGEDVRVRLNAEEAGRIGDVLGRDDRVYEGRVLEAPDTSLTLAVRSFVMQQGGATESAHQRIIVPRASIVELQRRTLDRGRTIGVVAIAVAATTAATIATLQAIRGGGDNGTKLPGEQNRIPGGILIPLRIAIPR